MSGKLVLVRHGESEYNVKGLWAGWSDVSITAKGKDDAAKLGEALKNIKFDQIYITTLIRTKQTLDAIQTTLGQPDVPVTASDALKERNYGEFAGKNKWEIRDRVGEDEFQKIRRSYDYTPQGGESLATVVARVVPYYKSEILPKLLAGQNILIVGHGNSDRALIKYIEALTPDEIAKRDMPFDTILIYTVKDDGTEDTKEAITIKISETEKA
jgi:2,3-bisphosphoglycerate-dependent phosphoglycerate mutase